jgi:prepilin-type N-terminal cleavage/methylation domain-containing protein
MMSSKNIRGFTLIELLVSMAVFLVLIGFMYPTFTFIKDQSSKISDIEALSERGQRIIDYIAEDIKMVGFVVGPKRDIPYCMTPSPGSGVSVLVHSDGAPFDSLRFIKAEPVEIVMSATCINAQTGCDTDTVDYKLDICTEVANPDQIAVDASKSCLSTELVPTSETGGLDVNAKSLITFRTEIQLPEVYVVTNYSTKTITLDKDLVKAVTPGTPVYALRQYEYSVEDPNTTPATLRRLSWSKDCDTYPVDIDEAVSTDGGIDGLQFEFIVYDSISGSLITQSTPPSELNDLRAIRIWLLVRSERADRSYKDSNSYALGSLDAQGDVITGVTVGPFNDNYRRILLTRTVEVKNLAM